MLANIGTIYKFPALLTLQGQEWIVSLYNPVIPGLCPENLHFLFRLHEKAPGQCQQSLSWLHHCHHEALNMDPDSPSLCLSVPYPSHYHRRKWCQNRDVFTLYRLRCGVGHWATSDPGNGALHLPDTLVWFHPCLSLINAFAFSQNLMTCALGKEFSPWGFSFQGTLWLPWGKTDAKLLEGAAQNLLSFCYITPLSGAWLQRQQGLRWVSECQYTLFITSLHFIALLPQ